MVAEKIRDILGDDFITLHNVKDTPPELMEQYDALILGIPTWDFGEIQEDWLEIWEALPKLNLADKIAAMYGMGDQVDYSEWFLDALGMLYHQLKPTGAQFIGFWPTEGYEFESPKPLTEDGEMFVGLALDDVNQFEQTDERVAQWCEQILQEIEAAL